MVFYGIRLSGMPIIRFACSFTLPCGVKRRNIIDHRRDMIEISLSDQPVRISSDFGERSSEPGSMRLYMPDCRYVIDHPDTENIMNMMSVGVESAELHFTRYDLPPEEIADVLSSADEKTFFLAEDISYSEEEHRYLIAQLQIIMQHYSIGSVSESMLALAGWFELISNLDTHFRRTVAGLETRSDSSTLYVYKAKKFICSHLGEKLQLERIASELGISVPYLCTLFRRVTGQTVNDYIGIMRCRQIREQILHTEDSFADICTRAGLHDRRYAQRLFKKTFGISMQRCRQFGKGLSLYHENPWDRDNIEQDIYESEEDK